MSCDEHYDCGACREDEDAAGAEADAEHAISRAALGARVARLEEALRAMDKGKRQVGMLMVCDECQWQLESLLFPSGEANHNPHCRSCRARRALAHGGGE